MTYPEALEWLDATQLFGIKLGLEKTRLLLDAAGNPERTGRFLHVAGTNGKGSVCAMIDAILRADGFRVGLTTSPHLVDFRERVTVNGRWISEIEAAQLLTQIRNWTTSWENLPTFFEIVTVLAVRFFADEHTDYCVLETGMGGRLDATNAVTPLVSVITPIGIDHAQWLGGTLTAIAAEKAGIFKPGVPAVSAEQCPEVRDVLERRAAEIGCPLTFVTESVTTPVGLRGSHQRKNAALAVAAVRAAGISASDLAVTTGLADVRWPGRFQQVGRFVLDGAHNPHGARQLVATWREEFPGNRPVVIFGALADKDFGGMLTELAAIAAEFWFVPIAGVARGETPAHLASQCKSPCRCFDSLADALAAASPSADPILVAGSLFLIGEALKLLETPGMTPPPEDVGAAS